MPQTPAPSSPAHDRNAPTTPLPIVVFDDTGVSDHAAECMLSPLTDLRATFDIRTGALTTLERLARVSDGASITLAVPKRLESLTREKHPERAVNAGIGSGRGVLLINGRCPLLSASRLAAWSAMPEGEGELDAGNVIVAARVSNADAEGLLQEGRLPSVKSRVTAPQQVLLSRPWHVRTFRDESIAIDLELLTRHTRPAWGASSIAAPAAQTVGTHSTSIDPTASVMPGVVLDASTGPIVIAEHATIRPGAVLTGPCYVGSHSTVMDRAVIRGQTAIGPWCKVGGEVGGCTFQGYSNKGHDGYLGDSYVGEWVNLGANTTNSNLLNTYGEIVSRPLKGPTGPAGSNERTGETFLGCILGDHVKTAICTRIMTGSIVGTGTMFAAGQPLAGTVPGFRWITDAAPLSTASAGTGYRFDKFMEVARAAMARRGITPSAAYTDAIRSLSPA